MRIASRGNRGNRGPNLGFTGGTAHEKDQKSKVQRPPMIDGTQRYGKATKNMTDLHYLLHKAAGFDSYLDNDADFPGRLDDFAKTIHTDNVFEQMGYLFLVHDEDDNLAFHDMLGFHADWETDPAWNFLSCAWKTFFDASIGRYITGVYTASHKKSVPDYYQRKDHIGSAADKLLELYKDLPVFLQDVTVETLFPPEGETFPHASPPHCVIPSHVDPFIHLGNVVHTIHRLRRCLLTEFSVKMSTYLMFEMIYAGLDESNNIYRFCKFADIHLEEWRNTGTDPIPKGRKKNVTTPEENPG
jgi:hypothetical protein